MPRRAGCEDMGERPPCVSSTGGGGAARAHPTRVDVGNESANPSATTRAESPNEAILLFTATSRLVGQSHPLRLSPMASVRWPGLAHSTLPVGRYAKRGVASEVTLLDGPARFDVLPCH